MNKLLIIAGIFAFLFVGCNQTGQAPTAIEDTPLSVPNTAEEGDLGTKSELDLELEAIEAEIEELNLDADFPSFTEADLELNQ